MEQVVDAATVGDQQIEAPVQRRGNVGHGVVKKVDDLNVMPVPLQLLLKGQGGGPVAHAEFTGEDQDLHVRASFGSVRFRAGAARARAPVCQGQYTRPTFRIRGEKL